MIPVVNPVQAVATAPLVVVAIAHLVVEEATPLVRKIAEIATTTEEIVIETDLEARMTVIGTPIGIETETGMMIVIETGTEK